MFKGANILELAREFDTKDNCLSYLSSLKWRKGFVCSRCKNESWSKHVLNTSATVSNASIKSLQLPVPYSINAKLICQKALSWQKAGYGEYITVLKTCSHSRMSFVTGLTDARQ
jgi:hypothetical protein